MNIDSCDRINAIEASYPVENIEYKGIKIWPFIRTVLDFKYFYVDRYNSISKTSFINKLLRLFKLTATIRRFPFRSLFIKRQAVLFTHGIFGDLRLVDGIYIDSFFNEIINHEKNFIPIVSMHNSKNISAFNKYINKDIFYLTDKLLSLFMHIKKNKIINIDILLNITEELGININIHSYCRNIISSIIVYKYFYRIVKPSRVYVICYYDIYTMAASYAAKEMGIPVIELQHGMIVKNHTAYMASKYIEPNPYPNYLFSFGEKYKEIISSNIYKRENIFITGRYYIDLIKSRKELNYLAFSKKYGEFRNKTIIAFAGQTEFENEALSMIISIVSLSSDIICIYIPREKTKKNTSFSYPNVFVENELDVYQCIQNSHITSTVYSTVAIESFAFGTPVILFNLNNMAKVYYGDFFSTTKSVYYADTPEEFLSYIPTVLSMNREKIIADGTYFYAGNHKERVINAIKEIDELSKKYN